MICKKTNTVTAPRIAGSLLKAMATAANEGPELLPGWISAVADLVE